MEESIYNSIIRTFPNLNWESLNQTEYPRIRFYFDRMGISRDEIASLTTKITCQLNKDEEIYFGVTLFQSNAKISKHFDQKLKERNLDFISDNLEKRNIEIREDMKFWYYFGKITMNQISSVYKDIVSSDFIVYKNNFQLRCYLFFPQSKIIVNLYDDRGMDIISTSCATLNSICEKWEKTVPIKKQGNIICNSFLEINFKNIAPNGNIRVLLFSNDFSKYSENNIDTILNILVSSGCVEVNFVGPGSLYLRDDARCYSLSPLWIDEEKDYEWAIASFVQDSYQEENKHTCDFIFYDDGNLVEYFYRHHFAWPIINKGSL